MERQRDCYMLCCLERLGFEAQCYFAPKMTNNLNVLVDYPVHLSSTMTSHSRPAGRRLADAALPTFY